MELHGSKLIAGLFPLIVLGVLLVYTGGGDCACLERFPVIISPTRGVNALLYPRLSNPSGDVVNETTDAFLLKCYQISKLRNCMFPCKILLKKYVSGI